VFETRTDPYHYMNPEAALATDEVENWVHGFCLRRASADLRVEDGGVSARPLDAE